MEKQVKGQDGKEGHGDPEMNGAPFMSIKPPERCVMTTSGGKHVSNKYAGRCEEHKSRKRDGVNDEVQGRSSHRSYSN